MADEKIQSELLTAYLDGELPPAQRRRLEQVMAEHPELERELQKLRALRQAVRQMPRLSAPENLAERVLQRAERLNLVKGHAGHSVRAFRWSTLLAAAVILVAAGVGISIVYQLWQVKPFSEQMASKGFTNSLDPPIDPVTEADRSSGTPTRNEQGLFTAPADPAPALVGASEEGGRKTETAGEAAAVVMADRAAPVTAPAGAAEARATEALAMAEVSATTATAYDYPQLAPTAAQTQEVVVSTESLPSAQVQLEAVLQEEGLQPVMVNDDVVITMSNMVTSRRAVLGNYMVYGSPSQLVRLRSRVGQVQSNLATMPPQSVAQRMMRAVLDSEDKGTVEMPDGLREDFARSVGRSRDNTPHAPGAAPLLGAPAGRTGPAVAAASPQSPTSAPARQLQQARPLNQVWSFRMDAATSQPSAEPAMEPMLITLVVPEGESPPPADACEDQPSADVTAAPVPAPASAPAHTP